MIQSVAFPGTLFGTSAQVLEFLRAEAAEATKAWPQYAGKFESYRLGRVTRTIRTKLGVAAEKGDLVIFVREPHPVDGRVSVSFWSRANKVDTLVLEGTVVEVAS